MTDLAAEAAGTLAQTAVRTAAKRAEKAVAKRLPGSAKTATKTLSNAAKASNGQLRAVLRKEEAQRRVPSSEKQRRNHLGSLAPRHVGIDRTRRPFHHMMRTLRVTAERDLKAKLLGM
jgi:hypothetical protein